jgi:hypothetical protein
MPTMFRPNGVKSNFKSIEEGEKAGYYASFNEMATATKKAAAKAVEAPAPPVVTDEAPPAPPVVEPEKTDAPPPVQTFDDIPPEPPAAETKPKVPRKRK